MLQVSCDCVSETLHGSNSNNEWRSTQWYVGKTFPIYCYHVSTEILLQGYEERLYLVSVTLRHTK